MKQILLILIFLSCSLSSHAQITKTRQVISVANDTEFTGKYLGAGPKNILIGNISTESVLVSFTKRQVINGRVYNYIDTLNYYSIEANETWQFENIKSDSIYIKGLGIGNIVINSLKISGKITIRDGFSHNWVIKELMFSDTVTNVADTVSRFGPNAPDDLSAIFSKWYQLNISADSTIEISSDIDFPTDKTVSINPGESWITGKRNILALKELYYRKKSTSPGTTIVRVIIEGY